MVEEVLGNKGYFDQLRMDYVYKFECVCDVFKFKLLSLTCYAKRMKGKDKHISISSHLTSFNITWKHKYGPHNTK